MPENECIKLNDDTIFPFESSVNNDCLSLNLFEIGAVAPHIYEVVLTWMNW